jgi:hypothetical protein
VRSHVPAVAAALVLLAGCGGSDSGSNSATAGSGKPPTGSIQALWKAPGEDVGLIQGTGDYAPGALRVTFLVIRGNGASVERPRARVWLARGLRQKPFLEATARLEHVGLPGGVGAEALALYVAELSVDQPGKYWMLAEPIGAPQPIQALGNVVVKESPAAPEIGSPAPTSKTPTLETAGGDLEALSTATEPEPALYRWSVAESLEARAPFVVAFATPRFCESRTCGPTVDVVDAVRGRFEDDGVRFIHVEIYEDNDPTKPVNRWVREWNLPSEPWVFVVGRDGRVAAKFEGAVSVPELTEAVEKVA